MCQAPEELFGFEFVGPDFASVGEGECVLAGVYALEVVGFSWVELDFPVLAFRVLECEFAGCGVGWFGGWDGFALYHFEECVELVVGDILEFAGFDFVEDVFGEVGRKVAVGEYFVEECLEVSVSFLVFGLVAKGTDLVKGFGDGLLGVRCVVGFGEDGEEVEVLLVGHFWCSLRVGLVVRALMRSSWLIPASLMDSWNKGFWLMTVTTFCHRSGIRGFSLSYHWVPAISLMVASGML